ncbi:MAG TPA: hypothetical protein VN802_20735 [Stellaceae bacterium]|nr:hypothetical protein [Stellaceae bacterium]
MSDTTVTAASAAALPQAAHHPSAWHDPSGFGFRDLIDIVNPLQHLPIIGSIYRWVTGDRPGEAAQLAGNALYGGPIGVAFSLFSAATEDSQGRDLGERTLAAVFGKDDKTTAIAAAPATATPANAPATVQGTAQAAAPAPTAATSAAAAPDMRTVTSSPTQRAPMPLFGGVALPPPGTAPSQNDPARDLINHNAATERQITAGARPAAAQTAPVPLVLPAGTLPATRSTSAAFAAPAPASPTDVSQKMLDALDKYMRLEQERKAKPGTEDRPAPAGVDLMM